MVYEDQRVVPDVWLNAQTVLSPFISAKAAKADAATEIIIAKFRGLVRVAKKLLGNERAGVSVWRVDRGDDLNCALKECVNLQPLRSDLHDAGGLFCGHRAGKQVRTIHSGLHPEQSRPKLYAVILTVMKLRPAAIENEFK